MRIWQFSVVGTLRRCSHESKGNVETRSIRMHLIGTARPRLDFSHPAKAGKISWVAKLDCPSQPRPSPISCPADRGPPAVVAPRLLQQRTGNMRHKQSLPEFGHEARPSDFLFRSFRHTLIPRYFEFRCLWISSNRCFRYSRYSCCNLGSLGEL